MYTKGWWEVTDSAFTRCTTYRGKQTGGRAFVTTSDTLDLVAEAQGDTQEEAEANAKLIAAAVNACIKVNPDNPMAVAESITELYEALKLYQEHQKGTRGHYCGERAEAIHKAIAAVEE